VESKYIIGIPEDIFSYEIVILEHKLPSVIGVLENIKHVSGMDVPKAYFIYFEIPIPEDNLCSEMTIL